MTDLASKYRHLFPVLDKVTYLNSCSQGALAIPVRNALNEYLDGMYEKGSLWDQWVMKQEELRGLVAQAFKTKPSNVAITSTASAGINSVLSSIDFSGARSRIITTDLEFPTMGQILHAQERRGAEVIHVESESDGTIDVAKIEALLDERVALVAMTHVCYHSGAITNITAISELAHKQGIPVLVDAYQSVGSIPIDFEKTGVDFLVGGFLKYMLGLPGAGFLLAQGDSQFVPTKTGWFASRDIFAMDSKSYDPAQDARRFQEGTPSVPSVYGAVAGMELLLEIGLESILHHKIGLFSHLKEGLMQNDFTTAMSSPQGETEVMIALPFLDADLAVKTLANAEIVVSAREGKVRISPHFYNTRNELDRLLKVLAENRSVLRQP